MISFADIRTDLDFLDLDDLLALARLVGLLLLLVLVLAVIEDLHDGRHGIGADFEQVQPSIIGADQRLACAHHALHLTFLVDQPHLRRTDLLIDPRAVTRRQLGGHWSSRYGALLSLFRPLNGEPA
jgi:hypothetical protein